MTDENNSEENRDTAASAANSTDQETAQTAKAEGTASQSKGPADGTAGPSRGAAQGTAGQPTGAAEVNLEALLKVPVALSIEVGRKKMRLDDLLETREGSVIELDKLLNEPLDILVNGALIAHGVIVLAQDRFGVQITDILSPEERARTL